MTTMSMAHTIVWLILFMRTVSCLWVDAFVSPSDRWTSWRMEKAMKTDGIPSFLAPSRRNRSLLSLAGSQHSSRAGLPLLLIGGGSNLEGALRRPKHRQRFSLSWGPRATHTSNSSPPGRLPPNDVSGSATALSMGIRSSIKSIFGKKDRTPRIIPIIPKPHSGGDQITSTTPTSSGRTESGDGTRSTNDEHDVDVEFLFNERETAKGMADDDNSRKYASIADNEENNDDDLDNDAESNQEQVTDSFEMAEEVSERESSRILDLFSSFASPADESNVTEEETTMAETPPPASPPKIRTPGLERRTRGDAPVPIVTEIKSETVKDDESVQERINRMKSGRMTDREKRAFLEASLTAGNRIEDRKPLATGITSPRARVAASAKSTTTTSANTSSSTPSVDSIYREMTKASSNFTIPLRTRFPEVVPAIASQSKKKEYLDMVTNPGRFTQYKATKPGASAPRPVFPIEYRNRVQQTMTSTSTKNKSIKDESENTTNEVISNINTDSQGGGIANPTENLKLVEKARQNIDAMKLLDQDREEMYRRDEAKQATTPEEEEKRERERLMQMIKAQEQYWSNKLARERGVRLGDTNTPTHQRRYVTPQELVLYRRNSLTWNPLEDMPRQKGKGKTTPEKRSGSRDEEPSKKVAAVPDDDASLLDRKVTTEVARSEQKPLRVVPVLDDTKKISAKDDRVEKLMAMNSPLPSRAPPVSQPSEAMTEDQEEANTNESASEILDAEILTTERGVVTKNSDETKTTPVRMKIPEIDDEGDGEDNTEEALELNPKMSVKEALKKNGKTGDEDQDRRAKKWGVDMSRFMTEE